MKKAGLKSKISNKENGSLMCLETLVRKSFPKRNPKHVLINGCITVASLRKTLLI